MAGPGVKYSSLALFVLGTGVSIACGQPGILPSGIASGDATPTSVVLWARADAPGDVVFELATDAPGFATDEPMDKLGTTLSLPPFLEGKRKEIEAGLKPL